MEEFPTDLVVLMDELSPIEFLKLAFYKLNKMAIESTEELTALDKVMCKAADISTKKKLSMISPALRERFFKLVAEKGLDKPPSILLDCTSEQAIQPQTAPSQTQPLPTAYFQKDMQPTLFQNRMMPPNVDPASFQPTPNQPDVHSIRPNQPDVHSIRFQNLLNQPDSHPGSGTPSRQDSEAFNKRMNLFQNVLDSYETEPFEAEISAQSKPSVVKKTVPQVPRRQYRDQSRSPPAAYKSRSSSRPRGSSRRSRSPPSRRSRSPLSRRSRSPPSRRSRSPPSRRSRSPPSRRSRSPSRRSRSPPSYRSFTRYDGPSKPEPTRDDTKDPKRDENSNARKNLSFSIANRKKYTGLEKPPFKL